MIARQRRFRYVRVGHDSPIMEFLPDGTVGEGCAACEQSWYVLEDFRGMLTFVLVGGNTVTCRLRREEDGMWRGRWLDHERMPIELIPVHP